MSGGEVPHGGAIADAEQAHQSQWVRGLVCLVQDAVLPELAHGHAERSERTFEYLDADGRVLGVERGVRADEQVGLVEVGRRWCRSVSHSAASWWVVAYGAGSPVAGPIGAAGPAARAGLMAEVEAALEEWQGAAGLAFPIEALLVSGRR